MILDYPVMLICECKILGFHGNDYEECCLLDMRRFTVWSHYFFIIFVSLKFDLVSYIKLFMATVFSLI
jgi:hypothetical protein